MSKRLNRRQNTATPDHEWEILVNAGLTAAQVFVYANHGTAASWQWD